jgi:hypothetical protein
MPDRLQARVAELEQQLAARPIEAPAQHQHLHIHGVPAEDIAAVVSRQRAIEDRRYHATPGRRSIARQPASRLARQTHTPDCTPQ